MNVKVYLKSDRNRLNAAGDYNPEDGSLVVHKGSLLSTTVSDSKTFRGIKSIINSREGVVVDNILQVDVRFKSPSTAANFVTGKSSNGKRLWKTEKGTTIGKLMEEA